MYVEFSFFKSDMAPFSVVLRKKIVNLPQHNNCAKIKRIGEI